MKTSDQHAVQTPNAQNVYVAPSPERPCFFPIVPTMCILDLQFNHLQLTHQISYLLSCIVVNFQVVDRNHITCAVLKYLIGSIKKFCY